MRSDDYRRRILVYWLPAILWAAIILGASSDLFSAEHSADWLGQIIIRVVGHPLPPRQFSLIHFLIRKAAHLTEYGILGALVFRAFRAEERGWRWSWAVWAVCGALAVAVTDEWHQLFVASRTGSGWDVLLDGAGATLAQLITRRRNPANLSPS